MAYELPSVSDFKSYFVRDFPYGTNMQQNVLNSDIEKAFGQAEMSINQGLFTSQNQFTLCFLWLAAHYLVIDLRAASQGIQGSYTWLSSSRSVGSVSESSAIPDNIMQNPFLAQLSTTNYGAKYLSLILPMLAGQMFCVPGYTYP